MLSKGKIRKLDSRTEVCLFIGYPKGTRGSIFYNPRDKKVFVSTHAMFLEHEYTMISNNVVRYYLRIL